MTIEMKNDQTPNKGDRIDKIVKAYINNKPRMLGLLHVLDLGDATINRLSELSPVGLIRRAVMCDCRAPAIPYHIRLMDHCVYIRFGRWFITAKYW